MGKRNRMTEFKGQVREKIKQRDKGCIFCKMGYMMPDPEKDYFGISNFQIMHFVPRSQGGLGIEENGAIGCIYHHNLLDNGAKTRKEMLELFENYLKRNYPQWDKKKLIYRKGEAYDI